MISNRRLLVVYSAPYFAYVCIASILGGHVSTEVNYILRILCVTAILLWSRQWFFSFLGPRSPGISTVVGIGAGIAGAILWILLLSPFVSVEAGEEWSRSAFYLRLFSAGLLVPIFEEVLMRGFVFRFALQWDEARKTDSKEALLVVLDEKSVNDVKPGAWSWVAVAVSTIIFTAGHHIPEWPASIAYGLLMSWLYISRKDLLSCIVAHAVTNCLLAIYVLNTEKWYLW